MAAASKAHAIAWPSIAISEEEMAAEIASSASTRSAASSPSAAAMRAC